MDHQKLNILLIFGTFSFGGCGGQGCYFWPNPRVISKKSAIQNSQITFKPKLACIFLPARAKWNINVCVGTPCIKTFFIASDSKTAILFNPKNLNFDKRNRFDTKGNARIGLRVISKCAMSWHSQWVEINYESSFSSLFSTFVFPKDISKY